METYVVPFDGRFIVYRPLLRLAFVANAAMVRYVREREGGRPPAEGDAERFLESTGFWAPDPPPPPSWTPSGPHRPTTAVLLMTGACNLRCVYCYARGGEQAGLRLTLPLAKTVIDAACENARAAGQGQFSLSFHGGGEPTLNWEVMTAAVEHARAKDLPCDISISSNGVWTAAQREFILSRFDGASVSFDGVPDVQNAQRPRADGRGSFDAVMETIRALDGAGFSYGIRMTAVPASFARLAESVSFLCEHTGCRTLQVEPCYAEGRGKSADPTPEQGDAFARAFLEAFHVAGRSGRFLFYSGARPWVLADSFCSAAEDALIVTPEGDLVTCFEAHDRRHPLISKFVAGRASPDGVKVDMTRVRGFAGDLDRRRSECEGCFCRRHCGGDCASRCMSSSDGNSGRCRVNRLVTREILAWYIAQGGGVWRGASGEGP